MIEKYKDSDGKPLSSDACELIENFKSLSSSAQKLEIKRIENLIANKKLNLDRVYSIYNRLENVLDKKAFTETTLKTLKIQENSIKKEANIVFNLTKERK